MNNDKNQDQQQQSKATLQQTEKETPQKKTGLVGFRRSDRPLLGRGYVTSLINHG